MNPGLQILMTSPPGPYLPPKLSLDTSVLRTISASRTILSALQEERRGAYHLRPGGDMGCDGGERAALQRVTIFYIYLPASLLEICFRFGPASKHVPA